MEQRKIVVQALERWVTGGKPNAGRQIFISAGADLEAVSSFISSSDVGFFSGDSVPAIDLETLVSYDGSLDAPGDQLFVDGQIVEVQEYLAAEFVEVFGPTIIQLGGDEGWAALVEDAEAATNLGIFPEHLLNPGILLADRNPLLDLTANVVNSRFHVRSDNSVTLGTQGKGFGKFADLGTTENLTISAFDAISGSVSPAVLRADTSRFHTVGRFIAALDLHRALKTTPADTPLVGFGLSLAEDDLADVVPRGTEPLLSKAGDAFLLSNLVTGARHRLNRDTALLAEVLQTSSTLDLATSRARALFDLGEIPILAAFQEIDEKLHVRVRDVESDGVAL